MNGVNITTDLLGANGSLFYANGTIDISRQSDTSIEVSFMSGIGVVVNLKAGMLSFVVKLTETFRGQARGLLGNFDSNSTNEFVYKNGTRIPDSSSDRQIHYFGLSCKKTSLHV